MSKICDLCKTENDDDSQFCDKCGNPLVDMLEEEGEVIEGEEGEAKKVKPTDYKLLAIPAVLVVIILIIFLVSKIQTGGHQKEAKEEVVNYLSAVKAENYGKALEIATGTGLTADLEKGFKEFLGQLTPPMPINKNLDETLNNLVEISGAIEKYNYTNGSFPSEINKLVPVYIDKIPPVVGSGQWGYEYDNNVDNYTIFVKGDSFTSAGLPENFPAYSRRDNLQAPDRKQVHGQWKVLNFEVLGVKATGKNTVQINVVETAQFGTSTNREENTYTVRLTGEKWRIDPNSSPIDLFSLTNAFTQMGSMEEAVAPPEKEEGAEKGKPTVKKMPLGMTLLTFSKIAKDPDNLRTRTQFQYNRLIEAINSVGAALSRYFGDHNGEYPGQLLWLVPKYIDKIPLNLAADEDTFSGGYSVSDERKVFTIASQGDYFKSLGIEDGFPQYSSRFKLLQKSSDIPEPEETPEPEESPEESPSPGETPEPGESPGESPSPEESPGESPSTGEEVAPSPGESPEAVASPGEKKEKEEPTSKEDKKEGTEEKKEEKKEEKPDDGRVKDDSRKPPTVGEKEVVREKDDKVKEGKDIEKDKDKEGKDIKDIKEDKDKKQEGEKVKSESDKGKES